MKSLPFSWNPHVCVLKSTIVTFLESNPTFESWIAQQCLNSSRPHPFPHRPGLNTPSPDVFFLSLAAQGKWAVPLTTKWGCIIIHILHAEKKNLYSIYIWPTLGYILVCLKWGRLQLQFCQRHEENTSYRGSLFFRQSHWLHRLHHPPKT